MCDKNTVPSVSAISRLLRGREEDVKKPRGKHRMNMILKMDLKNCSNGKNLSVILSHDILNKCVRTSESMSNNVKGVFSLKSDLITAKEVDARSRLSSRPSVLSIKFEARGNCRHSVYSQIQKGPSFSSLSPAPCSLQGGAKEAQKCLKIENAKILENLFGWEEIYSSLFLSLSLLQAGGVPKGQKNVSKLKNKKVAVYFM